jgi:hypothetical protein
MTYESSASMSKMYDELVKLGLTQIRDTAIGDLLKLIDTQPTRTGFDSVVDDPAQTRSTNSMAGNSFTSLKPLIPCPSCGVDITATLFFRAEQPADLSNIGTDKNVNLSAKLVGVDVKHNCVPRVTR